MKIAILFSGDLDSVSCGGIDRYIKNLIYYMKGDEITVFGTSLIGKYKLGMSYTRFYKGVKYEFIPITDTRRYPLSFFYMLREMCWLTEIYRFDIIYAQRTEFSIPFLFHPGKNKLVEIIHGSSAYSNRGFGKNAKWHLLIERIAISIAKRTYIILNREEYGVPYYKNKYKKFSDRFFYARNLIDTDVYNEQDKINCRLELEIDLNKIVILYFGRIENMPKRVLLFPDICCELEKRGLDSYFIVIGEGGDLSQLKTRSEERGVLNRFSFIGYLDDPRKIAKYVNAANFSLNISMFEGTCTSILESLACRTPVIATDVGDIHECLYEGKNGVIIPNGTDCEIIDNVVNAIEKMAAHPPDMDKGYMKYDGTEVAECLKKDFIQLIK